MTKRIIYIILGSLLILALLLGAWYWFFGQGSGAAQNIDSFGTGGDRTGTGGVGSDTNGNGQAPIGSTVNTNVTGGGTNTQIPIPRTSGAQPAVGIPYSSLISNNNGTNIPSNIVWNDVFNNGTYVVFNPSAIEQVQDGDISGSPYINQTVGADGKPVNLLAGLGVVIGGCILQYSANLLATKAGTFLQQFLPSTDFAFVHVAAPSTNATVGTSDVIGCLTRTLGRIAVQQITNSTVNWINSGFNGKPAFVQDYNKFFSGVADQAAGAYLQSSGFSFLCSPFRLQVKIAVAQSYARRGGLNAPSCSLAKAVNNVQGFLNGDFAQGGWGGLISFTTDSANNPFAAFMTLSGGLQNSVGQAQANATLDINLGQGFLSQKVCDPVGSNTNCKIVTPGKTIESSLTQSMGANIQSLQLGDSIDQILNALQNALISKILNAGLANVNKNGNSTDNANNPAQIAANKLMDEVRAAVSSAQQYGGVEQSIIADIQTSQQNLSELLNCWNIASTSPTLTSSQVALARAGGDAATSKVLQLQTLVDIHNQNIVTSNNAITAFQELQTNLLLATLPSDVTNAQTYWNNIKSNDVPHVYSAADITSVQQDRATIQSNLGSINLDTGAKLQQCYALGQ